MNSNDKYHEDPERFTPFGPGAYEARKAQRRFDASLSNERNWTEEERAAAFDFAPKLRGILSPPDPEKEYIKAERAVLDIDRALSVLRLYRKNITGAQALRIKEIIQGFL